MRGEGIAGYAYAILRVPCILAVWIALDERLQLLQRTLGLPLVAARIGNLVVHRRGDDVLGKRRLLGTRVQRRVTAGRVDCRLILAGFVERVGLHDDRAARLGRVGVLAIDLLELGRGVVEFALAEKCIGVGIDLLRRVGIDFLRRARREHAAEARATREHRRTGQRQHARRTTREANAPLSPSLPVRSECHPFSPVSHFRPLSEAPEAEPEAQPDFDSIRIGLNQLPAKALPHRSFPSA